MLRMANKIYSIYIRIREKTTNLFQKRRKGLTLPDIIERMQPIKDTSQLNLPKNFALKINYLK